MVLTYRINRSLHLSLIRPELVKMSFSYCAAYTWNNLQKALNPLLPLGRFKALTSDLAFI